MVGSLMWKMPAADVHIRHTILHSMKLLEIYDFHGDFKKKTNDLFRSEAQFQLFWRIQTLGNISYRWHTLFDAAQTHVKRKILSFDK